MATISHTTTFDLTLSPKQFIFTDTTDWAGQGIATADVNGCFTITSPSNVVIYNNNDFDNADCDIWIDNDLSNQTQIQLPLGSDGMPEVGIYTVEYKVYDSNALETYTLTSTFTYSYVQPTIEITQTVDCISPLFTSVDSTNYIVNGITPSIIRQHSVTFPVGSGLSTQTSASITMSFGAEEFANGTQTTGIVSSVEYTNTDGLIIRDLISGYLEIQVNCQSVCSIYCGMRSIEQQMANALTMGSTTQYNELSNKFSTIMGIVGLAKIAIECGKNDDVTGYLTLAKSIGNFTDDCCNCGTTPALVTGLAGLVDDVVVQSGDATVVVNSVSGGGTTTYTVTINPTFINTVNTLFNTAVAAGDNITVSSSTVGILTTYTVNGKEAIVAAGSGMSVSAGTVGYDTTYTISVSLVNGFISTNTAQTFVGVAPYSLESLINVTVPSTGTYIALFEGDVDTISAASTCAFEYYFMKTGVFTALGSNPKRSFTHKDQSILTIALMQKLSLTASDVIAVGYDITAYGGTHGIKNASISLYRIA